MMACCKVLGGGCMSKAICFMMVILISACNSTEIKKQTGVDNKLSNPDGSAFISSSLIEGQVLNSCNSCHSGRSAPYLRGAQNIRQNISKILSEVNSNQMPPPQTGLGSLTSCQKEILQKWSDLGLPDESTVQVHELKFCQQEIAPVEPPLNQTALTYQNVLKRILAPKCITCHNVKDTTEASGILFTPYEKIANSRSWRAPGVTSKIVKVLSRTDEDRMPPPEDGPALSAEEIDFISRWVDAGLPQ